MVLRERIELSTSPLPMVCSTTELPQHSGRSDTPERGKGQDLSRSWQVSELKLTGYRCCVVDDSVLFPDLGGLDGRFGHGFRPFADGGSAEASVGSARSARSAAAQAILDAGAGYLLAVKDCGSQVGAFSAAARPSHQLNGR
jgi:hypothetical protein